MHSLVLNWDNNVCFPTPCAPSIHTVYESIGPVDDTAASSHFMGLAGGGIKLLLLDLRLLKESPRFTMPIHITHN